MKIVEKAPAKINLSLDVLRKRPDGYHDVSMIMQSIELCDTVTVTETDADEIILTTNSSEIPCDFHNIAYKAAEAFKNQFSIKKGVIIDIDKKIPVAAGLAGGSTNAAAVLRGMNTLFNIGADETTLCEIGVKLGADVPFCILGGTKMSEGIGEVLTDIPSKLHCTVVLVKPDFPVSTKYVYENLRLDDESSHPDIAAARLAVEKGSLSELSACAGNILETVTCVKYPELEEIKKGLRDSGAAMSMMSGSGPTVFALYEDENAGRLAYEKFKAGKYAKLTFLTSF